LERRRAHLLWNWELASGRVETTLEGHASGVSACAVTPDGRRVVAALKVWDVQAGTCLLTHRANANYLAVDTTATAIVAGDAAGAVWFFDWPP
jgi:WD40 repeat protein